MWKAIGEVLGNILRAIWEKLFEPKKSNYYSQDEEIHEEIASEIDRRASGETPPAESGDSLHPS